MRQGWRNRVILKKTWLILQDLTRARSRDIANHAYVMMTFRDHVMHSSSATFARKSLAFSRTNMFVVAVNLTALCDEWWIVQQWGRGLCVEGQKRDRKRIQANSGCLGVFQGHPSCYDIRCVTIPIKEHSVQLSALKKLLNTSLNGCCPVHSVIITLPRFLEQDLILERD